MTNLLSVCGIEYLIIDENFKIIEMSLGLNHFADIPNEAKLGQDVRIVFPELEGLEDIFDAILQGEQNNFELKGIMRSQDTASPLYIDIRITNKLQEDHSSNRLTIVVEDATERMVLEQSLFQGANEANLLLRNLKASKQYIDQIVTSMADALLVTTLSGEIKKMNYAAQILLQYNEVELIGQPIAKVIREVNKYPLTIDDTDISHSQDINTLVKEIETVCYTKSCKTIPVAFSSSIVKTEIEHFQGYVYILRDMTERKQAELAKQEFLAMISHEVRTPIASVIGMAGLLQYTELTAEQQDFVETIYTSGNSLLKIINDFLDFSKIQSGNLELEEEPFGLRNCIHEAFYMLAPTAKEKGLKLTFLDTPELPTTIVGDITRLRQVLINLISNAIKFTETGSIEVSVITRKNSNINHSCAANTDEIQFSVKDTGMGIPRDRLERLFKAFSQVNSSITRQYGGTGLGLAICKQLCELMGGRIWVESELNAGSTFYFTIAASVIPEESAGASVVFPQQEIPKAIESPPVEQQAFNSQELFSVRASSSPSPDLHKLRILLTEDNLVNQKIALKQLKNLGYSADLANNGKEALQLLEKIPYDLVLMDCQMPVLDGLETTKQIHRWQESSFASGRRPVVIAMTANAMKQDKQMCLDAGMDDYLSKPVMKENLAATLEYWGNVIFRAKETAATEQTVSTTDVDSVDLPIDWERLHQLSENNPEFELELLQMFVEDIQPRLELIKIAIAAHDFEQLALQGHQIKGASANMGVTTMHLAAEKLEQLAINQERRGTTNLIVELEEFLKRIEEFLISSK
ncbi:hybrid sensor histidine kinase/response regulator [Nostoc sp. 'Lobaria pulmonaria (5183) cyanobiont']|uniref:hybrid sensor histidine kinase/response regulator n=1 Tax=Nostoc sp. 'Lobaria pulmonaria (5183) cyanobiont' TaxID=1618022 RepID=UPI001F4245F3|nr:PAS domain-containing hybrid sensor histidine kinase/response regulator [Nostoc sp. 'Lobaria pulmonaria (5183) cyanobiont']